MYLQHYGFDDAHCRLVADMRQFFCGAQRGGELASLHYALLNRKGVVKVVGEVGAGKTMLCPMLMHPLPASVHSLYITDPSTSYHFYLQPLRAESAYVYHNVRTQWAVYADGLKTPFSQHIRMGFKDSHFYSTSSGSFMAGFVVALLGVISEIYARQRSIQFIGISQNNHELLRDYLSHSMLCRRLLLGRSRFSLRIYRGDQSIAFTTKIKTVQPPRGRASKPCPSPYSSRGRIR